MNFTIKKIQARHPSRPIHLMKLSELLARLGVKGVKGANHYDKVLVGHKPTIARIWDLFSEAKRIWRERIAREHPDRGGSHEQAAIINSLWDNIERRFNKMGIGT